MTSRGKRPGGRVKGMHGGRSLPKQKDWCGQRATVGQGRANHVITCIDTLATRAQART
jgi:hypothetical protein